MEAALLLFGTGVMPERIVRCDVETAKHASEREAVRILRRMGRGSVASIAATAFLVGMIGTIFKTFGAFTGISSERYAFQRAMAQGISESLKWTAVSLLIAMFAFWIYRYIDRELETAQVEMEATILQLANSLSLLRNA